MKYLNLKSLIITKPTSAYEIINRVIVLIKRDHERLRMRHWFIEDYEAPPDNPRHVCNTTACMAGWIGHVIGNSRLWAHAAYALCGHNGAALELKYAFTNGDHCTEEDGTPEQGRRAVEFLQQFQAKHEELLKARIIEPRTVFVR
jgi:hypothetical protein